MHVEAGTFWFLKLSEEIFRNRRDFFSIVPRTIFYKKSGTLNEA